MLPFLLAKLPEFVFDIVLSMQTHAVRLLASAAERRARFSKNAGSRKSLPITQYI